MNLLTMIPLSGFHCTTKTTTATTANITTITSTENENKIKSK